MKVKKILLSMCAIAALASCSQNDDVVPAGAGGEEARVVLKLEGDAVDTRADVPATEEGAKIKDITVFFFNTTGFIVGTPKYIGVAADIAKPITTTTDASQVVVIANLGSDETTTGKKLAGVSSIDQLKTKVFSSVTTTTNPTTKHTINQTKDRLYMSGMGKVTIGSDGLTGTATVNLHFISAKINKVAISWKADNTNQNYSTLSVFQTSLLNDVSDKLTSFTCRCRNRSGRDGNMGWCVCSSYGFGVCRGLVVGEYSVGTSSDTNSSSNRYLLSKDRSGC